MQRLFQPFLLLMAPWWGMLFLMAILPIACREDATSVVPVPGVNSQEAVLRLALPPALRGGAGTRAVNEDAIQTVDILSFKADPAAPADIKRGTFFYRVPGTYDAAGQTVRATLYGSAERQTLVVLVNVRAQVNAAAPAYGEQKETVMNRLLLPATPDGMPDFSGGMPMWGELPNQLVDESYGAASATHPQPVTLIRSVVKVTLKSTNPPISHGIENIYVYNPRTGGRISPDNYDRTNACVVTPTVPAGATAAVGNSIDLQIPYFMSPAQESFYLFESDSREQVSATSLLGTTCLIVVIKSMHIPSGWGYYRIDFKDYTTDRYLNLLRNHEYQIEVESIDGPPASTPDEAYRGNYGLKCRIVPWNEVNQEVVVEGNKRLAVDKRNVYISLSEMRTGSPLTVSTEHTGGWTITDATPGIFVSKNSQNTDGTETIRVRTLASTRQGSFKLKAGGAEMEIKVKREAMPLDYVAEYNLAGGLQYGSYPSDASLTNAQTDAQLYFTNSHNNDQSGYYNGYVVGGKVHSNWNLHHKNLRTDAFFTSGEGKNYHIPEGLELLGIFSNGLGAIFQLTTPTQKLNVNEAVQYAGIQKIFASDYYCPPSSDICYALRFKPGTASQFNGLAFPKAIDNSMLCAYRYERVGSFVKNNLTSHIKVSAVGLGSSFIGDITTISDETWWNAHAEVTVTRRFPMAGRMENVAVGQSNKLHRWGGSRGIYAYYMTSELYWGGQLGAIVAEGFAHINPENAGVLRLFSND